jgi:hypothetical protein
MKNPTRKLLAAQRRAGYDQMQAIINSGEIWKFEGSAGRSAMDALRSGACWLPDNPTHDYYGNYIPARSELQPGTKGTLENAMEYYKL